MKHYIESHAHQTANGGDEIGLHLLILQHKEQYDPTDNAASHGEHIVFAPFALEEGQSFLDGKGAF